MAELGFDLERKIRAMIRGKEIEVSRDDERRVTRRAEYANARFQGESERSGGQGGGGGGGGGSI